MCCIKSRKFKLLDKIKVNRQVEINIYHKGCGTQGVPVFASENIELTRYTL